MMRLTCRARKFALQSTLPRMRCRRTMPTSRHTHARCRAIARRHSASMLSIACRLVATRRFHATPPAHACAQDTPPARPHKPPALPTPACRPPACLRTATRMPPPPRRTCATLMLCHAAVTAARYASHAAAAGEAPPGVSDTLTSAWRTAFHDVCRTHTVAVMYVEMPHSRLLPPPSRHAARKAARQTARYRREMRHEVPRLPQAPPAPASSPVIHHSHAQYRPLRLPDREPRRHDTATTRHGFVCPSRHATPACCRLPAVAQRNESHATHAISFAHTALTLLFIMVPRSRAAHD